MGHAVGFAHRAARLHRHVASVSLKSWDRIMVRTAGMCPTRSGAPSPNRNRWWTPISQRTRRCWPPGTRSLTNTVCAVSPPGAMRAAKVVANAASNNVASEMSTYGTNSRPTRRASPPFPNPRAVQHIVRNRATEERDHCRRARADEPAPEQQDQRDLAGGQSHDRAGGVTRERAPRDVPPSSRAMSTSRDASEKDGETPLSAFMQLPG